MGRTITTQLICRVGRGRRRVDLLLASAPRASSCCESILPAAYASRDGCRSAFSRACSAAGSGSAACDGTDAPAQFGLWAQGQLFASVSGWCLSRHPRARLAILAAARLAQLRERCLGHACSAGLRAGPHPLLDARVLQVPRLTSSGTSWRRPRASWIAQASWLRPRPAPPWPAPELAPGPRLSARALQAASANPTPGPRWPGHTVITLIDMVPRQDGVARRASCCPVVDHLARRGV